VGLIKELTLLPVAPLRFTIWVADKVAEEVDRQEFSTGAGIRKLEEIQAARERGEISAEEAQEREAAVLQEQMDRAGSQLEPREESRGG
jgi:hypothetical protein